MKKLIFDIDITGHHSEYIGHLVDYLNEKKTDETIYIFIVHPEFSLHFPDIVDKARQIKNVYWKQIKPKEFYMSKRFGTALSSFIEFKIVNSYAKELRVDHVYLLNFHSLKFPGMIFRPEYKISSILFHTFHRLKRESINEKILFYKRFYITKYCCKNPNLKSVFILNDKSTVGLMNKEFKSNQFKMLPDPIPTLRAIPNFNIYEYFGIKKNRKIFLHIGSLGNIKGTLEVLSSAKHINLDCQKNVTILLVGKARLLSDEALYTNRIKEINRDTEVQAIWNNNFVSNDIMKSLFDNCDAVLLPYKNTEFSSGILGHAAASGKTVIATGQGLIEELVSNYNLGMLLNEPTEINIAKKIMEFLLNKIVFNPSNNFVRERNPKIFSEFLLSN